MGDEGRLASLLEEWQRHRDEGRDVPAEALCAGRPDLVLELGRRIEVLRRVSRLVLPASAVGLGNPVEPGPDTTELSEHPHPGADAAAGDTPVESVPGRSGSPSPAGAPRQFGGYRLLKLLGQGGMGTVYLAEEGLVGHRVAVKVMRPDVAVQPDARARFLREARAASALRHDHVVPINYVGEQAGVPFIVMPLLSGETLEERLRREGRLPAGEVLRIGRETAEGLAAAHAAGMVHRDVKPANLWLEAPTGRVKVLDFGLARRVEGDRLTLSGEVLGTAGYMAPEQADGQPVDVRSDLFSLGCVLYRAATGEPPFRGRTWTAVLRAVAEHDPPPPRDRRPDLPAALSFLIERLLAKDPSRRPATACEVADALRGIESSGAHEAARGTDSWRTPSVPPGRRWSWTRRLSIACALALGLLLTGGLYYFRTSPGGANQEVGDPAPMRAAVDIRVWRAGPGGAARLRLTEPGALPLRPGDQFRIEATADWPAYLYLFWIDTEGKATPVYPWNPRVGWGTRPAEEQPVTELGLPPSAAKGYTISGDRPGMETLILVARAERLDLPDEQIQGWFAGLPEQRPFQNPESAVWFENGRVVIGDGRRQMRGFDETDINDPVLRIQGLLRKRIGPHAAFTAAVSFARLGGGGMP